MITSITENLWHVQHNFHANGLALSSRMTIVRLLDKSLWLHSPVPIDDAMQAELESLGIVRYIVAPNKTHHLFVNQLARRFPQALIYGAPGLASKRPDIQGLQTLDANVSYPWGAELRFHLFGGIPFLNETVWFHGPSQTLVLTDLCQCWQGNLPLSTDLYNRLVGVRNTFAVPRSVAWLMVKDASAAASSARLVLAWPTKRIIMCHNTLIESNAHAQLRQAFQRMVG